MKLDEKLSGLTEKRISVWMRIHEQIAEEEVVDRAGVPVRMVCAESEDGA